MKDQRSADEPDFVVVRGAREHNLDIDELAIPKRQLVVFTGVSGSGKSSLAFDTLYAEGQRRYVESLSSYARQFLGQLEKPKYDQIRGLSPTIAIEQKSASSNPRSTVGTVTEIYDYLRVLYARAGEQRCHLCGGEVAARSAAEIVEELLALPAKTRVTLLAPKAANRKGEFREMFEEARKAGFARARVDGVVQRLDELKALDKKKRHTVEVVVDRLAADASQRARLNDSVETALRAGSGTVLVEVEGEDQVRAYSEERACPNCGVGLPELSPPSFSFNSPLGMCVDCNGLGSKLEVDPDLVVPNPNLSLAPRRHRALGRAPGARRRLDLAHRRGAAARVRHSPRQAVEAAHPAPARDRALRNRRATGSGELVGPARRGLVGDSVRRRGQQHQTPSDRHAFGDDAAVAGPLFSRTALPRLQGQALAARVARGFPGGQEHRGRDRHDRGRGGPALRDHAAEGGARADRGRDAQGGAHAAGLPAQRRARLPDARPRGFLAFRWRGAADSAGLAARLGAVGRDVRAR